MLTKSKLNSIETLVSQALIDMEKSHEEFISILNEKDKYEKMKDNLRSENGKYEIMRLSIDISAETQNKAEVSVIKIHENDGVDKTVLLLLCFSDAKKKMG